MIGVELDPAPSEQAEVEALLQDILGELPHPVALASIGREHDKPISTYLFEETDPFYVRD